MLDLRSADAKTPVKMLRNESNSGFYFLHMSQSQSGLHKNAEVTSLELED